MNTQVQETGWQRRYDERRVTAEEAVASLQPGIHVYIPVAQQPRTIVKAIMARADLDNVTFTCLPTVDYGWFEPEFRARLTVNVIYGNPFCRDAVNAGTAGYTPFMFYGAHKAIDDARQEAREIDLTIISVTPPNDHGYVCLGASVWDAKTSVARAKQTIAVINQYLPRTFGDTWLHVSEIDWFVEDHNQLQARPVAAADPWDAAIAGYTGSLVRDRDTIQIGVGSTTGNLVLLGGLDGKHDLGYFGELTVPGTVDLVRRGVITSRFLESHPGRFVATTAGNSPDDRAFIDNNPMFEFYAVDYIHDPRVIAGHDNYIAINNAISIDLTGQIAASTIGPRVYSGTGGHLSFALGAFMSRGGRYICVLPSTAVGGRVSRIVPQFEAGQIVTVPRDVADTVVTEYGIAHLMNRSVRERAEALVAIAHPDFRAELHREMQRLFWP